METRCVMFREMRRKNQQLTHSDCMDILKAGTSGVLAVSGDGGYPYAVPLSYVYRDGKIWFHCATSGHKLDAIARDPKVSFCVIAQDQVVPREFTSYFRSVIVFGRARVLTDDGERRAAIRLLAEKYFPGDPEGREAEIQKDFHRLAMVELTVEHMTGKEAMELVRDRNLS